MQELLIDSTIIIEYLKNGSGILSKIMDSYKLNISLVTYTELLATKRASNGNVNRQIRDFISEHFELKSVTTEIASRAGDLLRELDITLAHAYIAATAIEYDYPLLTYDIKTFDQVPELKLVEI
jgi:predicted nucleic acid-binding protein